MPQPKLFCLAAHAAPRGQARAAQIRGAAVVADAAGTVVVSAVILIILPVVLQPVEKLAIVRVIRIDLDGALCVLKGVYLVAEIHIGNGAQIVPASVALGKRNLRKRGESFVVSAVAYVVDRRAALCALLRLLIRAVAAETTESAIACLLYTSPSPRD